MTAADFQAEREAVIAERGREWWHGENATYDPRFDDPFYPDHDERREQ